MDTIFLWGRSAYEYWHGLRTGGAPHLSDRAVVARDAPRLSMRPARIRALPGKGISDAFVREVLADELRGFSLPLETLVAAPGARTDSALKTCRVWGGPLADGSFVRAGSRVCVSTPEFLSLQMGRGLPLGRLLGFLYELCGFYAVCHWGFDPSARCRPLMTARSLGSYVARIQGVQGVKPMRRALRFLRDASGSPMETAVVLLLCLPPKLGGYGLPFPQMNGDVNVPAGRPGEKGSCLFCDMLWADRGFAVEYDGRLYHEGSDRVHRDYARANALRFAGIDVEVVTSAEVSGVQAFDEAARRIARSLGVRLRGLDGAWRERRWRLWRQLLRSDGVGEFYGSLAD